MRKLLLILLAAGMTVMLAGSVFGEDPPDAIVDPPGDPQVRTMRFKLDNTEPGPIDLPIARPRPIVQPLNGLSAQFAGGGIDLSGGALPSAGGRGSASQDPIQVTKRRIKKVINLLEE